MLVLLHFSSSPTVTSTLSVAVHFVSWGRTLPAEGALGSWGVHLHPLHPLGYAYALNVSFIIPKSSKMHYADVGFRNIVIVQWFIILVSHCQRREGKTGKEIFSGPGLASSRHNS
jgi:hypothetical protein